MDFSKLNVIRLNNRNYRSWSFKVEMLMRRENTWGYVDPGEAPNPVTPAWQDGDSKARATIALLVEDNQHNLIMTKTTAKATWAALKAHHQKATLTGKVSLLKEICSATYKEGENMEEFLYGMEELYLRLENSGEKISQYMQVAMILRSLPKAFDALTTALESRSDEDLTMDLVRSKLIGESEKLYGEQGAEERVLKASGVGGTRAVPGACWSCGKVGHQQRNCEEVPSQSQESSAKGGKKKKKIRAKPDQKLKTVRENGEKSFTFMVRANVNKSTRSWIIDSGATSHMTSDKSAFVCLKDLRSTVTVADGTETQSEGIGDCVIACVDDVGESIKLTLRGVLYVPSLEGNLISVSKLTSRGCSAEFVQSVCKLKYENTVVAVGDKIGDMYYLRASAEKVMKAEAKQHTKDCVHSWHRRMGHRDPEVLKKIKRNELATGINVVDCGIRETCECCIEGKMPRPPFPKAAVKVSKEVLDIIHTDVCGPMGVVTPGGCRYYMTMIDDHSRYTFVYFLKQKSEVEDRIREYVRMVENQFGRKPRVIRSDQGGEYSGKALRRFYADEGIKVEYTTAYSPQQNGVSERKNRSLCEMGRCMLLDAGMSTQFWAEAINTACYLQNRLPSSAVERTPYEIWHGRKPDLSHLKLFGCSAYVFIPSVKRKKLDVKAIKMTFVGYSSEHKAYRMLNTKTGDIETSRDVRFLELGSGSKERQLVKPQKQSTRPPRAEEAESVEFELANSPATMQPEEQIPAGAESEEEDFLGWDDVEEEDVPEWDDAEEEWPADVPGEGDLEENDGENAAAVEEPPEQPVRRSERATAGVPPIRYQDGVRLAKANASEPRTFREAVSSPQSAEWKSAMDEEFQSHQENGTWELTELPPNRKAIGCKWIYKCKVDEEGNLVRYKARLVAQGFCQKYGSDYDLVFAPVVKQITFRMMLTVASKRKMLTRHVDVKTAYLYGQLQEEIFMRQPPGYERGGKDKVCKIRRSLYGLKQAARVWNQRLDGVLQSMRFQPSKADPCLYVRGKAGTLCFLLIYVDDIIVICATEGEFADIVGVLKQEFKITVMGDLKFFLGIQVRLVNGQYRLNQKGYLGRLLERFGMSDAKTSKVPMDPGYLQQREEASKKLESVEQYQSLVGALLYVAVCTRPDISIATSILGRRVQSPTEADWNEAKRVLRYLKLTMDLDLCLGNDDTPLECYVDADWAGDVSDRKSSSGYLFKFRGGIIGWGCRKQKCVSLSSTEAEYVALAECLQELLWIRKLMDDAGEQLGLPILVNEDNQSCIALTKADRNEKKSKHIDTKYSFVKDLVRDGIVQLQYCSSENMWADLLTKPLHAVKLKKLREAIGVKPTNIEEEC